MSTPYTLEGKPLASVDIESTGLTFDVRQITEIAIVRREDAMVDNEDTEVSFFVEVDLQQADQFALSMNHFWDKHPLGKWISGKTEGDKPEPNGKNYLTRTQAAYAVAQGTHGAHILGLTPYLDIDLLSRLLVDEWLTSSWRHPIIDAKPMMWGFLRANGFGTDLPWGSEDLAAALGIEEQHPNERHTALGDAKWTMQMWDRIAIG